MVTGIPVAEYVKRLAFSVHDRRGLESYKQPMDVCESYVNGKRKICIDSANLQKLKFLLK